MIIIVQNTFEQRLIGFLHELLNCSIVTATLGLPTVSSRGISVLDHCLECVVSSSHVGHIPLQPVG